MMQFWFRSFCWWVLVAAGWALLAASGGAEGGAVFGAALPVLVAGALISVPTGYIHKSVVEYRAERDRLARDALGAGAPANGNAPGGGRAGA